MTKNASSFLSVHPSMKLGILKLSGSNKVNLSCYPSQLYVIFSRGFTAVMGKLQFLTC